MPSRYALGALIVGLAAICACGEEFTSGGNGGSTATPTGSGGSGAQTGSGADGAGASGAGGTGGTTSTGSGGTNTGTAGTGGTGAFGGGTCGTSPDPSPGSCPQPFCDVCENGKVCIKHCDADNDCAGPLVCPAGFECRIVCMSQDACDGATIQCPDTYKCEVRCSGTSSCSGAAVQCSDDGVCVLSCNGDSACDSNAKLYCGYNSCAALCMVAAENPDVTCGQACYCEDCT